MDDLVSVIVPVYNTKPYLEACVSSLAAQTHRNLQIILVDDGSTDGSGAICDDFARRDQRITVIHQRNAGVSAARNAGLWLASGDYLTFVDSDDTLVPHAVETALSALLDNDADMVTYGWQKIYTEDHRSESCSDEFAICTDIPFSIREMLMHYCAYGGGYPWNKLWRKDSILFGDRMPTFDPELYYFEDLEWVIRMMLHIRKLVVCSECLYHYRIHSDSVTHRPEQAERRELGYHRSIERIIGDLELLPDLQRWFSMKYAPEIVNGILLAIQNRQHQLCIYLSGRLRDIKVELLRSDAIPFQIKFRCLVLQILQTLHLL